MSGLLVTWLLMLADAAALMWIAAIGVTARYRARELRERERVTDWWAVTLNERERELQHREYRLRERQEWLP